MILLNFKILGHFVNSHHKFLIAVLYYIKNKFISYMIYLYNVYSFIFERKHSFKSREY